jgi:hypothetical protein
MTTMPEAVTRSPALQRVLEDLEAERYRPVPPPPAPTPHELDARTRMLALLTDDVREAT